MSYCKEENSTRSNVNKLNVELNVTMLDIIPIPMIIVDNNEKIQFINKAYAEFLKKDRSEIIGLHIYKVIKNSRIPLVMKTGNDEIAWRHKFTGGQDAIVDRVVLKDNNDRVMGCFGMLLFNNISELYNLANKNKILKNELKYYKNELKNIRLNCITLQIFTF